MDRSALLRLLKLLLLSRLLVLAPLLLALLLLLLREQASHKQAGFLSQLCILKRTRIKMTALDGINKRKFCFCSFFPDN